MPTAVVLAGGLGTRLRTVVSDVPKVLAPVGGIPFLSHILTFLNFSGVDTAVLCTGYMGDKIREYYGSGFGSVDILYSHEEEPLGTGGALRLALPQLNKNPVLVMNGDSLCKIRLPEFYKFHEINGASATIACSNQLVTQRAEIIGVSIDGKITYISETTATNVFRVVSSGIYLFNLSTIEAIPSGRFVSLEKEVFQSLMGYGLYGYLHGEELLDIGTPESYDFANGFLS